MKRNLTCIVCPLGCDITVEFNDNGEISEIKGNTCPRGAEYAKNECTNPVRTITTTIMCDNGVPVPVKTNAAVPKNKIFDCMKIINSTKKDLPISAGDVIIENICGSGADVIATADMEK